MLDNLTMLTKHREIPLWSN